MISCGDVSFRTDHSIAKSGHNVAKSLKPAKEGVCDVCGSEELIQRKDDTEEIAKSRFNTYFEQTAPLIDFYEKQGSLKKIDANGEVTEVWERLLDAIK